MKETKEQQPEHSVSFLTVMGSVFAAFFGVQSQANRQRDFSSGKLWHFIAAGLVFVLLFILSVWLLVQYLVSSA